MTVKHPTPQGISRLLASAGFTRTEISRFVQVPGFSVTRDRRDQRTVRVAYRVATRTAVQICKDILAAYAKTITEAGWSVEAGEYELTVTAREDHP